MSEQPCILVSYLYRRDPIPGSVLWHMNRYGLNNTPAVRVPGFVEQRDSADQFSVVLAVPCSPTGEFEAGTEDEYEELADEYFGRAHPEQELA